MKDLLKNKPWIKKLTAIIAGILLSFAFSPFDLYFLSFVSLGLIFYLWSITSSHREAFVLGYLFGFSLFGVGVNWLHISINLFGGVNLIGAFAFTYMLVAFIALYPALCGYLAVRFFNKTLLLSLPALWLLTEWFRGWLLTGFPWLNLGTSQTNSLLANYAPVIGDYGISYIVCLIASALIYLINKSTRQKMIGGALLLLTLLPALLLKNVHWTNDIKQDIDVALIQGAIPQELKWEPSQRQKTYEIYAGLSEPYWSSDLIIWPETAIPSFYHRADDFIKPISANKKNNNALFMSGLAYKEADKYYNSILLIDDTHRFYHKHHLVPFGEYLPLKSILGELLRFLKIPMSDFASGQPDQKSFKTSKGVFGMSICYEDAYGIEVSKALPEANILINVSNDAWFGDSFAPHQHLQIARMRALENSRYLLRSTNTGISAIIDNKGKVISRSPQFKPHALADTVKLFEGNTLYSQFGNTPILLFAYLTLIFLYYRKRSAPVIQ